MIRYNHDAANNKFYCSFIMNSGECIVKWKFRQANRTNFSF